MKSYLKKISKKHILTVGFLCLVLIIATAFAMTHSGESKTSKVRTTQTTSKSSKKKKVLARHQVQVLPLLLNHPVNQQAKFNKPKPPLLKQSSNHKSSKKRRNNLLHQRNQAKSKFNKRKNNMDTLLAMEDIIHLMKK